MEIYVKIKRSPSKEGATKCIKGGIGVGSLEEMKNPQATKGAVEDIIFWELRRIRE